MAAVSGDGSSQAAASRAAAASSATRLSASRCRTAWKELIGRPNWIRSSACCARQLEHGPPRAHQLVAEGQLAQRQRRTPSRPVPAGSDAVRVAARDLDEAERGIEARAPVAASRAAVCTTNADVAVRRRRRRRWPCRVAPAPPCPSPRTVHRSPSSRPGASHVRSGGRTTAAAVVRDAQRRGQQLVERGRGDVGRAPGPRRARETAVAPVGRQRVAPAELVERGVERLAAARLGERGGCALRRARAPPPPSPVVSEVEEPPGDDVALDLGAAAVDASPPGSRGTRRASAALTGSSPSATSGPRPSADQVEDGLLGRRQRAPCRWTSPRPSVSPAASRRWVARDRARKAHTSSVASPTAAGRAPRAAPPTRAARAAAAGRRRGATAPCCARRAAGPWRRTSRRRPRPGRGRAGRRRRRRRPRRTRRRRASSRSAAP